MESLRSIAITIRQPWAWLIVNGYKQIENRDWVTAQRGRMFIHAAQTMTRGDYEACQIFVSSISSLLVEEIPPFEELKKQCGGLVGVATLDKVYTGHTVNTLPDNVRDWFTGRYGFLFIDAKPIPFTPLKGRLGFFPVPYEITLSVPK
jgi:hypothetical protein